MTQFSWLSWSPRCRWRRAGQRLTSRLGVGPRLHDELTARVVHLAQFAVLSNQAGGTAAVRGRALFPDLADVFCAAPGKFLPGDGGEGGEGQAAGRAKSAANLPNIHGSSAPDWLSVTSQ